MNILEVKNLLKKEVFEKQYVSVGRGTEKNFGVSVVKFKIALADLKVEGYKIYYVPSGKIKNGLALALEVLSIPGTKYEEVFIHKDEIKEPASYI